MSIRFEPKVRKQSLGIPGYGHGIWWLMAASGLLVFALVVLESNRAISGSLRMRTQVEVERIPVEEAKTLGISPRSRK